MKEKLTRQDAEKIQAEIDHRKLVLRPQILDAVREARAQGDLSENFEYYAAKRENGINNSRIRYLEQMLKNSVIVEDHSSSDEVGLNKSVTVSPTLWCRSAFPRGDSMLIRFFMESPRILVTIL